MELWGLGDEALAAHRKLLYSLAAVALAGTAQAAVVNGSFEMDPGVPGQTGNSGTRTVDFATMPTIGDSWGFWQSVPGWQTGSSRGVEIQTNRTLSTIDAHSGSYHAELDTNGNSSIFQDIFLSAGRYVLSFWYSPRVAQADTNDISYSLDGLVSGIASSATPGAKVGEWLQIQKNLEVERSDIYTLGFFAGGASDTYGGLLDDVSVDRVASTPLPAGSVLALTALGGLLLLRRRRTPVLS